jgi:hypothetical protein
MKRIFSAINWFVRGKDGRVQIVQMPNVPIIGWFVFMVLSNFSIGASLKTSFSSVSLAFLSVWAYLEVTCGASRFRRVLGVVVAMGIVLHFFRSA